MTQTAEQIQDEWVPKRKAAAIIRCSPQKLENLLEQFSMEIRTNMMNRRERLVNISELKRNLGRS